MKKNKPLRIISLVPSITQTFYDLGLEKKVVGITNFCPFPTKAQFQPTRVGGPKDPDIEFIQKLKPDLVVANPEENPKELIKRIREKVPIHIENPKTLNEGLRLITTLGEITGKTKQAKKITDEITREINQTQQILKSKNPLKCVYLIWKNPYMTINHDTYIHDVLKTCKCLNVFADEKKRYPKVTKAKIKKLGPELIFLPDEPYPFSQKDREDFSDLGTKTILLDGKPACWYGSKMKGSLTYIREIIWTH